MKLITEPKHVHFDHHADRHHVLKGSDKVVCDVGIKQKFNHHNQSHDLMTKGALENVGKWLRSRNRANQPASDVIVSSRIDTDNEHKDDYDKNRYANEQMLASPRQSTLLDGPSPIEKFFAGRAIFITGSSGFVGKVLLEKLLRCYPAIRHIYLLMRPKRNQSPQDRLDSTIFNVALFDQLRRQDKSLLEKVSVIAGDISQPRLGISDESLDELINADVSIIFNSAATVKFDEPLKRSVELNLAATRNLVELARKLPNLVSLCHVSTAYANSNIRGSDIEEKVYPMAEDPGKVIELAKWMEEDTMQTLKYKFLRDRPNTYTYTKALAEKLLCEEAYDLPVVIIRPSIVVASWVDPIRGWVDNLNGPTGLILAVGKGVLRTLHVEREARADLIPVDTCINLMIAAAWKVATTTGPAIAANEIIRPTETTPPVALIDGGDDDKRVANDQAEKQVVEVDETAKKHKRDLPVYHCTSGELNPITWGFMETMFLPVIRQYPSSQVLRYPGGSFKSNKYVDQIFRLFVHLLPALLLDVLCVLTGNKPIVMNIYKKIHSAIEQLNVFLNNDWSFKSDNMLALYEQMDPRDKAVLPMDIRQLNWHSYFHDYVLGARTYVLKESITTLPKARSFLKRAYYIDIGLSLMMVALMWFFFGSTISRLIPISIIN